MQRTPCCPNLIWSRPRHRKNFLQPGQTEENNENKGRTTREKNPKTSKQSLGGKGNTRRHQNTDKQETSFSFVFQKARVKNLHQSETESSKNATVVVDIQVFPTPDAFSDEARNRDQIIVFPWVWQGSVSRNPDPQLKIRHSITRSMRLPHQGEITHPSRRSASFFFLGGRGLRQGLSPDPGQG